MQILVNLLISLVFRIQQLYYYYTNPMYTVVNISKVFYETYIFFYDLTNY